MRENEVRSDFVREIEDFAAEPGQMVDDTHLPAHYEVNVVVRDPETIASIVEVPIGDNRDNYLRSCLKIGAMALKQTASEIDSKAIRDEGKRITEEISRALSTHRESVIEQMSSTLSSYFDPNSGKLNERLGRLTEGGGELEQAMRKLIGEDGSELAATLAHHVGESSPLLKMLDPDSASGVIRSMTKVIETSLAEDSHKVLSEFSLDREDGALNRFLKTLTTNNNQLTEGIEKNIKSVVDEFSLDKEDSALSRLVKQVDDAQKQISAEFTLDSEGSALARMKKELVDLHKRSSEDNQKLLREIHASVESLHARKQEAARSTTHGQEFELELYNLVNGLSQQKGDVAARTGSTTGSIRNCKVGDIVVTINPDHDAAGKKIVIEAKDDASYTMAKALEESEIARKNRDAEIGIFVFSKSTAPEGLDTIQRIGNHIVTVWDINDSNSDLFPEMAISVAQAICRRADKDNEANEEEIKLMNQSIREIEKQAGYFDEMTKWAETIRSSGGKIVEKIRTMKEKVLTEVGNLDRAKEGLDK